MTPLCELAIKYDTDKFSKHNYTPIYYDLVSQRRERVLWVMELGIKRGASLRMWEEFFPNAMIFGIDIKKRNAINEGRIKSFIGDENNVEFMKGAAHSAGGRLDFVVDDASHKAKFQIKAALTLLPFLASDGIYVIEDIQCPDDRSSNDPNNIVGQMPPEFNCEVIRTNELERDSVLIVIRRKS